MMRVFSLHLMALLLAASTVLAESDVEFILDLSGSMRQKLGNETQIESARKSLLKALDEISPKQLVALRVYGHRVEQTNKTDSCKDTELLIPFKKLDKKEVAEKIGNLVPKGYTPIAYSLQESRNDLLDVGVGRESERVIILMTDGEETCDGDPVAVLRKLKEEGFHLTVYTVGFNVNDVARKQLQDIAAFTGGRYFDAKDGVALEGALRDAAKESAVVIDKKKAVYGNEIRGGDSYETAVAIEPNKEYRLDHHQKINEYDYFSFDVKPGDDVTVTLSTREKGISFGQKGQAEETTNPYAGLQLHNLKRERLKKIDIIGTASKVESQHYRCIADEKLVLLLGSTYEAMNKDHVLFKVSIERKGDADTQTDAGENMETALPVEAKRYAKSSLGDTDTMDVFSLQAKKGESYVIGVIPNNKDTGGFNMRVYDDFKQELFSRFSGSNNGVKSSPIEIKEDGTYFIELQYQDERPMDYSLVIKRQQALEVEGKKLADNSSHNKLTPGTLIAGRYTVVDQLGSGGIGEVYRVADQELNGQIIALKVLRAGLAADEATFQRFRNEVFVARALVHPNLVRIFDIGKAPEGYSFITMELVEGVSLKALLDEGNLYAGGSNQTVRQGRITGIDQLVALYEQLLEGVAYAHSQGVIHRDLKPANILLGKNGAIKLLDFGTARFVESDLNLTQSGQLVGTPLYMAPEQIRGEKLDARCDVYALGLIGYEIATGKRPFAAEDVMSAMYNHLQESIPTFASASNGIPPWYEAIIFRACHKNRAERFEDAGDLLNAIRQRKIPGAEKRTSKGRIGAALMGLLVVGVCSALALRQRENLPPQPSVIEQTTQRESPAMDIPDELLEEQAKVEQTTQSSVSSSESVAPTPLATATPPAPSIPRVISTGVVPRTEEPTPSGTPSLVPSPIPCPIPSPTARVEPEVGTGSVADISLRDSKSTVPATEFDADAVSDLRALAIVSDAGALNRSSQSVAASSKFAILREGSGELIRTFPVRILSEPIEGRDELRLGANLHDVPGISLSPGTYRLELLLDGKPLGVLHFSVFPLR